MRLCSAAVASVSTAASMATTSVTTSTFAGKQMPGAAATLLTRDMARGLRLERKQRGHCETMQPQLTGKARKYYSTIVDE